MIFFSSCWYSQSLSYINLRKTLVLTCIAMHSNILMYEYLSHLTPQRQLIMPCLFMENEKIKKKIWRNHKKYGFASVAIWRAATATLQCHWLYVAPANTHPSCVSNKLLWAMLQLQSLRLQQKQQQQPFQ